MDHLDSEKSQRKREAISTFISENNLTLKKYTYNGKTLWLIDEQDVPVIDQRKIREYIDEQERVDKGSIVDNCFGIASAAVKKKIVSGCLYNGRPGKLTEFTNHCVNYDILPDGSNIAIDFTAQHNVDHEQGNFDTLAIRSHDMQSLLTKLGQLYGKEWRISTPRDIEIFYNSWYKD